MNRMNTIYFEAFKRDREAQEQVWRNFLDLSGVVELGWIQPDEETADDFNFKSD